MRVAIVTDDLRLSRGGSQCYLFSIARRLIAAGHSVHMLHDYDGDRIEGGEYHRIQVPRYPRVLREWYFCRQADRRVRALSADAVFTLRPFSSATHYRLADGILSRCFEAEREACEAGWQRRLFGVGLRLNAKRQWLIHVQRTLLTRREPPRLLANSMLAQRQLEEDYGISVARVTLLYSGVDLDTFHPAWDRRSATGSRQTRQRTRLLFVGHSFVRKGLSCLLRALASRQVADLDWELRVVGKGQIRQFRRQATSLGIASRVEFLESVPRDQMPDLYRSSSVLILPTFYDPCSLAALEAMACGCPVITTRQNGASELIESGRNGWVINRPGDLPALAAAVEETIRPGVAAEWGREAAVTAQERLNLNDHVQAVTKWLGAW